MKKGNVIDLMAYREKLNRDKANNDSNKPKPTGLVISDELKSAIETLIVKLRAKDPHSKSS